MNLEPQMSSGLKNIEEVDKFFLLTRLIHVAMVIGIVLFGGVVFMFSGKQMSFKPDFSNPVILIAILVCLGNIGASFLVAPMYRKVVPAPTTPAAAMKQYQAMCLVRWALIEGGAMFCGVVMLITRNILPAGLMAITVAALAYRYPSKEEFVGFTERKG